MNGARTPRSAINSSTLSGERRSPKSRGSALDGLSNGLRPQNSVANVWGSVAMQRLSTAKRSRGSVGTAVVTFGVRAAVGGAFAAGRTVGSAVVTFGVRAAVGGAFAAGRTVGSAVVTFGVRAAVGGAFAARGTVGSAVLTLWVRAAVGGTLAAVGRGGDVVVVEWHGDPFRHRICLEYRSERLNDACAEELPGTVPTKRMWAGL